MSYGRPMKELLMSLYWLVFPKRYEKRYPLPELYSAGSFSGLSSYEPPKSKATYPLNNSPEWSLVASYHVGNQHQTASTGITKYEHENLCRIGVNVDDVIDFVRLRNTDDEFLSKIGLFHAVRTKTPVNTTEGFRSDYRSILSAFNAAGISGALAWLYLYQLTEMDSPDKWFDVAEACRNTGRSLEDVSDMINEGLTNIVMMERVASNEIDLSLAISFRSGFDLGGTDDMLGLTLMAA